MGVEGLGMERRRAVSETLARVKENGGEDSCVERRQQYYIDCQKYLSPRVRVGRAVVARARVARAFVARAGSD